MRSVWIMLGVVAAVFVVEADDTTAVFVSTSAADERPAPHVPTHTRIDIYGNEISEALADYRVDARGSLYERHAPEMALPKLGAPSS